MGLEHGIYLGIILEVPVGWKPTERTVYLHPTEGRELAGPFDPQTGVKAREEIRKGKETVFPFPSIVHNYGLDAEMFAVLERGYTHRFYIFNKKTKYSIDINVEDNGYGAFTEIPPVLKWAMIEEFKAEFKPYLDIYEKEYGPVIIKYGLLTYRA
jgi:hypothetical protein